MKVIELIKELQKCNQDQEIVISLLRKDEGISFYDIDFISLTGDDKSKCHELPIMINASQ